MSARPSLAAFLAALVHNWAALMSGGLSVPIAGWGLFVAPDSQKELFFGLAVVCLFLAAYFVWAKERDRVLALESGRPLGPDWPIADLFWYLRPDLRGRGRMADHEGTGAEVRDKLSTGQLRMWGRRKNLGSPYGAKPPLTEIPPGYWEVGDFTYFFLVKGSEVATHTRGGMFGEYSHEYEDLRLNQAEARLLWPSKLSPKK
jgi:hypothetical protein